MLKFFPNRVLSQCVLIIHTNFLISPVSYNCTNGLTYTSMTPKANYSIVLEYKLWATLVVGSLFDCINILSTLPLAT
jgi:hypothetical protein